MPINKSNIKPFACRVTRINGTRNKSITSNLARKGFNIIIPMLLIPILVGVAHSINVSATGSVQFVIRNDDVKLELTIPSSAVELSMNTTTSGTFNYASFNVSAGTNNPTGYTLTMDTDTVLTGSKVLTGVDENEESYTYRYTIPTLNTGTSYTTEQFASSNETMNKWGYKKSSDTNYIPVASTGNAIASTSEQDNPNTTTVNIGAKLDNTVPADSYTTTLVFNIVANPAQACALGTICYDRNMPATEFASSNSKSMGDQSVAYTEESNARTYNDTILWASNFKRDGYGFAGWNTKLDGTGTSYGPNQTLTSAELNGGTADVSANGLQLYAMWIPSTGDMQGWNCPNNTSMPIGTITALTDTRDNNVYAVAKLTDGKCWMIENLRLGNYKIDGVTPTETLSSANTHNPSSGFTSLAAADNGNWCTSTSNQTCRDVNRHNNLNTLSAQEVMTDPTSNVYSYGNYYNWYTTTAGTGTSANMTIATNSTAPGDICPNNWRVPKADNSNNRVNNEIYQLALLVTGEAPNSNDNNVNRPIYQGDKYVRDFLKYPYNFSLSGELYIGIRRRNVNNTLNSATIVANNLGNLGYFRTDVVSNMVLPATTLAYEAIYGGSIRCLAGN
ncbi:hypothetical protein IKE79_00345 [Candidatus Saccharibacteria bacterium]|nr:hypothetical protein [Candidatus Saccharibacteria bacterium]